MRRGRIVMLALAVVILPGWTGLRACNPGEKEVVDDPGMPAMSGMAAKPRKTHCEAVAAPATVKALGESVVPGNIPPVRPAPSEGADALEAQRQELLASGLDDSKAHVNRVFDQLKSGYGKPLTGQQLGQFKDYMAAEEHLKDTILEKLPPQAYPDVKKILNDGDYTQAGELDRKLKGVFERFGADWSSFALKPGLLHPFGGEYGAARSDAYEKMLPLMEAGHPLATPLMLTDAVATWLMDKEQNQQHDDDWKAGAGDDPFPYLYSGRKELANGQTEQAIADLSKAIALDPNNAQALGLRGQAEAMKNDMAGAAKDAAAALRLNPADERMQRLLAIAHEGLGPGASAASGQAIAPSKAGDPPGGPAGRLNGGAAAGAAGQAMRDADSAMRLRDYALAVGRLTQAIALNGDNVEAYNLRAIAYNLSGQYGLALKDAVEGLKKAPKSVSLLLNKAVALNKLRRYAEAEAAAREAIAIDPKNAQAYAVLAEALAGQRRNTEAIAALRSAAGLNKRFEPKLQQALQLPSDADLMFLFSDEATAPAQKESGLSGKRRVPWIVGGSLLAGVLLGVVALSFMKPRAKAATVSPALTQRAAAPGLLQGRYRVGRQIGVGGMGVVYEGEDLQLKRKVAIKKMRDEIRLERRERERFVREAKVVAGLHHPGIVDVFAILEENEDVYLIFEFVPGKTLHETVYGSGPMALGAALSAIKEAGAALDYAHAHDVIHRDLKPSNIMLTADGKVKVMDFGIARVAKDALSRNSMTNTVVGTPPYMAPEQEQGVVRRESDVYGLAICLYEMLCAKMPFNGSGSGMLMNKLNKSYAPATKSAPGLPPGIDAVFARAFEPDPEKRFHSSAELIAALEALSAARI